MAVVAVYTFRTRPGRFAEHVAITAEGCALGVAQGVRVAAYAPLVGGEPGSIIVAASHDDFSSYAAAQARLDAAPEFQAFMNRALSSDVAEDIGSTLLADTDPTFVAPADAPGVLSAYVWRPRPGKAAAFLGDVATATGHITRLGGRTRVMQTVLGGDPMTILVSVGFDDLAHYGEFNDKLGVDEQWQAFWINAMSDPTGDLVRSGLYVPIGQ
jgi:hypothetical protein